MGKSVLRNKVDLRSRHICLTSDLYMYMYVLTPPPYHSHPNKKRQVPLSQWKSSLPEDSVDLPMANWGHRMRRWHMARAIASQVWELSRTPGSMHRKVLLNGHLLREMAVHSCHLLQREPSPSCLQQRLLLAC